MKESTTRPHSLIRSILLRTSVFLSYRLGQNKACRFCALTVQKFILEYENLELFQQIHMKLAQLGQPTALSMMPLPVNNDDTLEMMWSWPGEPELYPDDVDQLIVTAKKITETSGLFKMQQSLDAVSDAIQVSKFWLNTCLNSHKKCREQNASSFIPTRLVSIDAEPPRLVHTADWKDSPPYATLSHRWGDLEFMKLTQDTIHSFGKEIPTQHLTKTFQDAIYIARQLGVAFLWIDSLCTIQNDANDWEKEAMLMASVYGGSTVNIAASSAKDGSEGCFLRPPDSCTGLEAEFTVNGSKWLYQIPVGEGSWLYSRSTKRSVLGRRAWVMQERYLATRTLHCSSHGFFWECKTQTASESLPNGVDCGNEERLIAGRDTVELFLNSDWKLRHWTKVVEEYSRCDLTYSKDKLVAIAGIARTIQDKSKDQYCAGMWRRDLDIQPCWRAFKRVKPIPRPSYRAPSWPWAAVDGQIRFGEVLWGSTEKRYTRVLDVSVIGVNDERYPLGQVSSGELPLRCSFMVDAVLHDERQCLPSSIGAQNPKYNLQDFNTWLDCAQEKEKEPDGDVLMLPFLIRKYGYMYTSHILFGLIIRVTDRRKGQYRRVGQFMFRDFRETDILQQVFKESGAATAEKHCARIIESPEGEDPEAKYVITII